MIKLSELLKEFERTMSAAAFAEQGEHATARQMLNKAAKSRKRVLLGTDELELDPKIIKYTLKLCQRMEGGLEILHVNPVYSESDDKKKDDFLQDSLGKEYEKKMLQSGIIYHPVWTGKSVVEEIVEYVSSRRNIISVVVRSPEYGAESSAKGVKAKEVSTLLRKIQCPVVFFGDSPKNA